MRRLETLTHTQVDSREVGWQMGENNPAQESVDEVLDWMPQSMNLAPAGRLKQKRLDENIEVVDKQTADKRIGMNIIKEKERGVQNKKTTFEFNKKGKLTKKEIT